VDHTLVAVGLLVPLLSRGLAARTRRIGLGTGIVLAAIAVLEFAVLHRWVLSE
jgi:hypothetical protein